MTAIVSAVSLYNTSHINVVDPSPSSSFSFLQLMNSSLDAILATGTEAIGGYSAGGYGAGGAITMETERRRSSAPGGAVGLATQQDQPLAESPSAAITGTAVPLFPSSDSFHHAIAQETQGVTTNPASPTHPTSLAYHHQPNHPIHVSSPSPDLLYSSSSPSISSPSPSNIMSVTSVMHEAPSTSNSTTASTTKRTAPDEYAEGSSSRSSKKNRKSRMVVVAGEDVNDDKPVVAAEKQQVSSSSSSSQPVHQKEETKQSASQPPSPTVKPPSPPRSPSPPHDHKPAVPSPLCPSVSSPCIPSRPTLTRRRSRGSEIALLKFALDPWLRLSRSLDGAKTVAGAGCKQAFNPATFPATGNLRELRMSRSCASPLSSDFGGSCGGFELSLPFNFGGATSDITFGFGNGDLAGGVKWNLVDA